KPRARIAVDSVAPSSLSPFRADMPGRSLLPSPDEREGAARRFGQPVPSGSDVPPRLSSRRLRMKLTSNGHEPDTSPGKFGVLPDWSAVIEEVRALWARIEEDGYLLLRGYLDRDVVLAAREEIFSKWAAVGAIDLSYPLLEAIAAPREARKEVDQAAFSKDL